MQNVPRSEQTRQTFARIAELSWARGDAAPPQVMKLAGLVEPGIARPVVKAANPLFSRPLAPAMPVKPNAAAQVSPTTAGPSPAAPPAPPGPPGPAAMGSFKPGVGGSMLYPKGQGPVTGAVPAMKMADSYDDMVNDGRLTEMLMKMDPNAEYFKNPHKYVPRQELAFGSMVAHPVLAAKDTGHYFNKYYTPGSDAFHARDADNWDRNLKLLGRASETTGVTAGLAATGLAGLAGGGAAGGVAAGGGAAAGGGLLSGAAAALRTAASVPVGVVKQLLGKPVSSALGLAAAAGTAEQIANARSNELQRIMREAARARVEMEAAHALDMQSRPPESPLNSVRNLATAAGKGYASLPVWAQYGIPAGLLGLAAGRMRSNRVSRENAERDRNRDRERARFGFEF